MRQACSHSQSAAPTDPYSYNKRKSRMLLLLRLMRKIIGWVDFFVFTALMYLLSWLPWPGKHPVARMFNAWCRSFVRALDVDLRLHQKNRKHLPKRFILIANHPT